MVVLLILNIVIYFVSLSAGPSEDQLPPQPLNLQAVPSHSSMTLSWSAPIDQSIVIQGYILGYGADVADETIVELTASQFDFTITGLAPETQYVIKLRAFNQVGEGAPVFIEAMTTSIPGKQLHLSSASSSCCSLGRSEGASVFKKGCSI